MELPHGFGWDSGTGEDGFVVECGAVALYLPDILGGSARLVTDFPGDRFQFEGYRGLSGRVGGHQTVRARVVKVEGAAGDVEAKLGPGGRVPGAQPFAESAQVLEMACWAQPATGCSCAMPAAVW